MKAFISSLFATILVIAFSSCNKETIQPSHNYHTGKTPTNSYTGNIKQAHAALLPSAINNLPKSHTPLYEELPDKISGVYYGNIYGHPMLAFKKREE